MSAQPSAGVGSDGQLARLLWLVLFSYYLLILGGHHYSIDGIVMFESARQLFFHHSLVLDPPVVWGTSVYRVSPYGIGLVLAYLPLLALQSPLLSWLPALQAIPYNPAVAYNPDLYVNVAYLLCSWLNPLLTATTGRLVFRLARLLGMPPGWSVAAALAYGIASPAAAYSRYDFAQPLASLALAAAVWGLLRAGDEMRPRPLWSAGGALALALLTRAEFVLLGAWAVAWTGVRSRSLGVSRAVARSMIVAAPIALAGAIYLGLNRVKFGAVGRTGFDSLHVLFPGSLVGFVEGLAGLLASPGCGLLVFFPLSALAAPGLVWLIRAREPAGALFAGISGVALAIYSSFHMWWAGWSWGPRFLVPLLPLLALASTLWASRSLEAGHPWARRTFLALSGLGVLVMWNGILFDIVPYYSWIETTMGIQIAGASQFHLAVSPLVSGWSYLATTTVDLPAVRLWREGHTGAFLVAAAVAVVLLCCLAWSGHRLLNAVGPREEARTHAQSAPDRRRSRSARRTRPAGGRRDRP